MAFNTDDPNMLDEWLTVGPLSLLAGTSASHPRTTRLLGANLALWLDEHGKPHARTDEAELVIQARYDYAWVCPSGTPRHQLFAFPEYEQSGRRIVDCGGLGVAVSGLRVVENFLDMAHFPFVHTGYLGRAPHTEVADYRVETSSDGELWATECRFWQPQSSASSSHGDDVHYRYRVMHPMTAMLYKSCFTHPHEMDAIALFIQPVDEERVIAHCLMAYYDDDSSQADLISFQHTIFGQDKPILENHVLKRMPLEGRAETPTRCDAMSVAYRRWLKARHMRFGVLPA